MQAQKRELKARVDVFIHVYDEATSPKEGIESIKMIITPRKVFMGKPKRGN